MEGEYRIEGLDELIRKSHPSMLQRPLREFFEKSAIQVQGEAKRIAPVDSGRYRSSITYQVDKAPLPMFAKIGSNLRYARPIEFGTGLLSDAEDSSHARYFPPPAALDRWARRHGWDSGFMVARAIYLRGGTEPRKPLRGGLENAMSAILGFLKDMAKDLEKGWR